MVEIAGLPKNLMEVIQMSSRVLRNALLSTALFGCLALPVANAATSTGTFFVRATVEPACEVDASTTDMNFNIIDLVNGNTATSTLAYRCTSGVAPDAALAYDFMTNGGTGVLNYTLYQDTTGPTGTVWDDTSTQTLPPGTGFNSVDTVTVYGEVTSAQATADGVENGIYVDEVTVTLTF
jgi:spore coat protein U-like protein